ncbi:hypothetical protein CDAR_230291 [Caerostris darwini]|uniref:Uncharacterized protein n=1 Tax=Caerostris darwini TaxID=1538125 RepID=A0AAV4MJJ6_9ARAC|nr:hypothetical protein CDAR_230291 [Caerostris darwini]
MIKTFEINSARQPRETREAKNIRLLLKESRLLFSPQQSVLKVTGGGHLIIDTDALLQPDTTGAQNALGIEDARIRRFPPGFLSEKRDDDYV